MPVIRSKLRPPGDTLRAELVGRLLTELADGVGVAPPRPVIFELPDEVLVVWKKWEGITHNDRASIILEAYRTRETQTAEAPVRSSQILLTLGITPDEAIEMGLLPYSIQSSIQRGHPNYEAILEMEKNEGAIETRWGWVLGFPSRELAKETYDRLRSATAIAMPEVHWQIGQQVGRVGYPNEARDT
jgi:hypothetical protein